MNRLAIITTHPIQYNAPLFKLLNERNQITIKVFYTWGTSSLENKYDPGFKKNITWDIPLLNGYEYSFVKNTSSKPGSHHYRGIANPTLIADIEQWGADAILFYGWKFKSHFKAIKYFKNKVPVFFRGDSNLMDEISGIRKMIRSVVLKYVYKNIDVALFTGAANKAYFKAFGLDDNQLFFMPHAIDNKRFSNSEKNTKSATSLRSELGIPYDALVFLFAGKLESKKQPDVLAKVFSSINDKNIFLLIVGSGDLEASVKSNFSNYTNIIFLGFRNQNQMPAIYNTCDVFILPSKGPNETWGLAINEAMAAGKAIICSNACGASLDIVRDGENGIVFDKNNTNTLLDSLNFFIKNIKKAKSMGLKSTVIIEDYSYENDCLIIEKLLLSLNCKKG